MHYLILKKFFKIWYTFIIFCSRQQSYLGKTNLIVKYKFTCPFNDI